MRLLKKLTKITMNKKYTLIVGHNFSLSNETDSDVQSDYFPGAWGLKTQKRTLEYAKKLLADGDTITVTDYDNPSYHKLANKFIKELGLKQPLFTEVETLPVSQVTNGNPSTLSELKRRLSVGAKVRVTNYGGADGATVNSCRDTFVKGTQSNSVVFDKNGGNSWLEFGKAADWTFTNEGAKLYFISREGVRIPSVGLVFLPATDYGQATVGALNRAKL